MNRNYIGFANTYHDPAISIVNSKGKILFAEAAERYYQNKRAVNLAPDPLIRMYKLFKKYCEPEADLVLASSWGEEMDSSLNKALKSINESEQKVKAIFTNIPSHVNKEIGMHRFMTNSMIHSIAQYSENLICELSLNDDVLHRQIIRRKYKHHYTHAATACFSSPYSEGICSIIDGYGEETANAFYIYKDNKIKELITGKSTASLGYFYAMICHACGFSPLAGDEWKVMGLASYGKLDHSIYNLLKPLLKVEGLEIHSCDELDKFIILKKVESISRKNGQSPLDVSDLAYTGQYLFSEIYLELLNNLYDFKISENLILGGGCCLNSLANGKILKNTKFKNAYIPSAPADDGNALGCALLAYYEDHPSNKPNLEFQSPYLGSEMSSLTLDNLVKFGNIEKLRRFPDTIHEKGAELLASGKIIGWIQGRAEFGPRALGNRSILADPRSTTIKNDINSRVKFREEFRPLAPSILHEFGPEYFEDYYDTPYMERALVFKQEVVNKIPGAVHEGNTGRLQSVTRERNIKFYQLIKAFYNLTGIPLLINTSYNVMGKPISHSIEDVIAVFYTTGLDALIINDYLIEK